MSDVALVMGSISDWETMEQTASVLSELGVSYTKQIISAHRMPDEMFAFSKEAQANGYRAIIAGAGGAAHLPGMILYYQLCKCQVAYQWRRLRLVKRGPLTLVF